MTHRGRATTSKAARNIPQRLTHSGETSPDATFWIRPFRST